MPTPWPSRRVLDLLGVELPIIQAPMAGAAGAALVAAVSEAGGLGSLPCAMLGPDQLRSEVAAIRGRTRRPFNLNFFCHPEPIADAEREARWRARLAPYYAEFGVEAAAAGSAAPLRAPFDDAACGLVEELRPAVVSFHFGLPDAALVARVKAAGAVVLATATTVAEARWLERAGCDAVIAQGAEAGGHRGTFLAGDAASQVGTVALVPQVADAVGVPVIAAGGIGDGRGIAAAFALGAAAAQLGTAYLRCPEATVSAAHRAAVGGARDDATVLTNVFTGRPARGFVTRLVREVGPLSPLVPAFPLAGEALAPLRGAGAAGASEFAPLWAGQAAPLARALPAGELTRRLAAEAAARTAAR